MDIKMYKPVPRGGFFWEGFVHALEFYYYILTRQTSIKKEYGIRIPNEHPSMYINEFLKYADGLKGTNIGETLKLKPSEILDIDVFKDEQWFYNSASAKRLRNHILKKLNIKKHKPRSIGIIHRDRGPKKPVCRKLLFEDNFDDTIKKQFGVTPTYIDFIDATFREQVKFFNNHDIVLAAHGAELGSLPFMADNNYCIEYCQDQYYMQYYTDMAKQCDANYSLCCSTHDQSKVNDSWRSLSRNEAWKRRRKTKLWNIDVDTEKTIAAIKYYFENGKPKNIYI